MPETFDELMAAVLNLFPDGELGEDNDGQIIVYTGLKEYPGGVIAEMPPSD